MTMQLSNFAVNYKVSYRHTTHMYMFAQGRVIATYRRSGFNCEVLIIVNL